MNEKLLAKQRSAVADKINEKKKSLGLASNNGTTATSSKKASITNGEGGKLSLNNPISTLDFINN